MPFTHSGPREPGIPTPDSCSLDATTRSDPAPRAADEVKTPADVLSVIDELGFETSD